MWTNSPPGSGRYSPPGVLLQVEALDLAAVPVGAFRDADVADVLDLADGERPLYLIPVGHPAD
ncbi:MAG: nitroreductase family protein [Armatimonadota bacterium]